MQSEVGDERSDVSGKRKSVRSGVLHGAGAIEAVE